MLHTVIDNNYLSLVRVEHYDQYLSNYLLTMYYHQLQHNQDLDIDLLLKTTENLIHFSNLEMKLMNCQLLLIV